MILYIMILVGIVQLLGGALRLITVNDIKSPYGQGLVMYWILVIVYFAQLWILQNLKLFGTAVPEQYMIIYILVVPWIIAIFYWEVIYSRSRIENKGT